MPGMSVYILIALESSCGCRLPGSRIFAVETILTARMGHWELGRPLRSTRGKRTSNPHRTYIDRGPLRPDKSKRINTSNRWPKLKPGVVTSARCHYREQCGLGEGSLELGAGKELGLPVTFLEGRAALIGPEPPSGATCCRPLPNWQLRLQGRARVSKTTTHLTRLFIAMEPSCLILPQGAYCQSLGLGLNAPVFPDMGTVTPCQFHATSTHRRAHLVGCRVLARLACCLFVFMPSVHRVDG